MRGLDPITQTDFQRLSEHRLQEAEALLASGQFAGAYYLAGYAVECALKACLCKNRQQGHFPPRVNVVSRMYSHDLSGLLELAGLTAVLEAEGNQDAILKKNWAEIKDWSEESRYNFPTSTEAQQLHAAVADSNHGVLQWLRRFW